MLEAIGLADEEEHRERAEEREGPADDERQLEGVDVRGDGRLETPMDDPRVACVRERFLEARLLGVEDEVPVDVDLVRNGVDALARELVVNRVEVIAQLDRTEGRDTERAPELLARC